MKLVHERPTNDMMILKGRNERADTIEVVLKRSTYQYPLLKGK